MKSNEYKYIYIDIYIYIIYVYISLYNIIYLYSPFLYLFVLLEKGWVDKTIPHQLIASIPIHLSCEGEGGLSGGGRGGGRASGKEHQS